METLPYLTESEKVRAYSCARNVEDKLNAVKNELLNEKPYKYYLIEKLESILWDTNCIISMCKNESED